MNDALIPVQQLIDKLQQSQSNLISKLEDLIKRGWSSGSSNGSAWVVDSDELQTIINSHKKGIDQ